MQYPDPFLSGTGEGNRHDESWYETATGEEARGERCTSHSLSPIHRTFLGSFSPETPVSGGCFVFSDPFLSVKGTGFSRLEPW